MTNDPAARSRRAVVVGGPQRSARRSPPSPEDAGAKTRVAAQRHLDGRGERLRAYAAALEAAVAAGPPAARRAQLERQLAGVRQTLDAAGRARIPGPAAGPGAATGIAADS
jgi:hypothetical protein